MKGVNIFLANGFEDMEALGTRDVLVRGGVDVNLISITDEPFVVSSHGVTVGVDDMLCDIEPDGKCGPSDVMIFPGGMPGSKSLGECRRLIDLMNEHYAAGGSVAAICAAPKFVLGQLKGIENAEFTCFDGCEAPLIEMGAGFLRKPAVTCGRIITGRSAGYAIDFGLAILRHIKGEKAAADVAAALKLACD